MSADSETTMAEAPFRDVADSNHPSSKSRGHFPDRCHSLMRIFTEEAKQETRYGPQRRPR